MPLTALHATQGVLDATLLDLGCGVEWTNVHRVRPRAPLRCPACAEPMHAKVSPRGLRFFAHDQLNPDCARSPARPAPSDTRSA